MQRGAPTRQSHSAVPQFHSKRLNERASGTDAVDDERVIGSDAVDAVGINRCLSHQSLNVERTIGRDAVNAVGIDRSFLQ